MENDHSAHGYILSRASGWGLQQTTRAAGSDKTPGQGSTQKFKKEERTIHWTRFTKTG